MKLHTDGTLEGTPEEISAYMKMKDPMFGKMYIPLVEKNVMGMTNEGFEEYLEFVKNANAGDIFNYSFTNTSKK